MKQFEELSKEISYALRHAPWEYELEMDLRKMIEESEKKKCHRSDRLACPCKSGWLPCGGRNLYKTVPRNCRFPDIYFS